MAFVLKDRLAKWQNNVHPVWGTYVENGRPANAWRVGPLVDSIGLNVAAWLTEYIRGAQPTHGSSAYMNDWSQFPLEPWGQTNVQSLQTVDPGPLVIAGENIMQDARPFIQEKTAADQALRSADYSPTNFVNRGTSRPGAARRIFNVEREGNLWWLTCLDERIAVYHRSRPAYDARNRGNALTRLLAASDSVSRIATGEQMTRVISLVTAPESPFPRIPLAVD
jgi:hypothetical protein